MVLYHGEEEKGREGSAELLALNPLANTMQMVDYPACNHLLDIPAGLRVSMKGASFTVPLRTEFVRQVLEKYTRFTNQCQDAAASTVLFELYDPAQGDGGARRIRTPPFARIADGIFNGLIASYVESSGKRFFLSSVGA